MDNDFILSRVFSHLPLSQWLILEAVSSTWYDILARSWRSVKSLSIENDFFDAPENYPTKISDRDETEICMVLKKCGPYLTRLHLARVNVRKPFFRNVRRFTARHELSERILSAICQYCTRLKALDLSYHIFPTWASFELLRNVPETIEILLLEICRLDEEAPSENGMTELMNTFFGRSTNLRVFSLWGSCYGYWTITERDLLRVPPSLVYLDLSQGFTAKIGGLRSWIPALISLQQLHLERTSINDDDLRALVETCRGTLQGLTLAYAKSITDFAQISSFSKLRYLRLDGNRDRLIDPALDRICQDCLGLRLLNLENCNSLTANGLRKIANLRQLRHLSVCSILAMNDECLAQICGQCPKLRSLQLKYCRRLTRCGLVCLPELCKLKYLGVSGLAAFDQSIAECLRLKCRKLSTIEAFNCDNYR